MGRFLEGNIKIRITSADCSGLLNKINAADIKLSDVVILDDLTMQLTVSAKGYNEICRIAEKLGGTVEIIMHVGQYWTLMSALRRPVILLFACAILLSATILSGRVLFIAVDGNKTIPTNQILEAAEECGIRFGAKRRQVRSEMIKNALLQEIPQLQWAGVNTSGCTAVISVKEKTETEHTKTQQEGVGSIVAARDGVIQSCTVYKGTPLCAAGQAVKAGQTLVSGYTDLGIITQAERASAEITAITFRQIDAVSPDPTTIRGRSSEKKNIYFLRIGKKLIKLSKDSGIVGTTCAKIYSEEYVHLPGGFRLPLCLIKQTVYFYEEANDVSAESVSLAWLADFAADHLRGDMIAGQILSSDTTIGAADGVSYIHGSYTCVEIIGQIKYEETISKDVKND